MLNVGIVSEYNPFHNGHKYHISKTKQVLNADCVIAVMSGNFTQRGEPAIFDKYTRALCALKCGADIVIEIPAFFSCASAEYFAMTAISIMHKLNIIDFVSFGTESNNLEELKHFSKLMDNENDDFKKVLAHYLSKGISFPAARQMALSYFNINPSLTPNNILALEYLKALRHFKSNIKPFCLKRVDNGYNSYEPKESFVSATAIRDMIYKNDISIYNFIPEEIWEILESDIKCGNIVLTDNMSHILNFTLRERTPEYIKQILDVREGIENKIYKSLKTCYKFSDIVAFSKSKRYSYTGIQRILTHIILDLKSNDMNYFKNNGYCPYIHIIGFKKSAVPVIKNITDKASVPVIINIKKDEQKLDKNSKLIFEFNKKADDIYYMCQNNIKNRYPYHYYTSPPVIL